MNKEELYEEIILLWGWQGEFIKLIEELSELQKEACKILYNNPKEKILDECNIVEEIADTEIMIEQIKHFLKCEKYLKLKKEMKLERLENMIKKYIEDTEKQRR